MSAADLLRRAADRIEELAGTASHNVCPDWTYSAVRHIARNCEIECYHGGEEPDDGLDHDGWSRYDDAPWISTMGPQIAAPLAAWLRAAAEAASSYPGTGGQLGRMMRLSDMSPAYRHTAEFIDGATALARVILGEES